MPSIIFSEGSGLANSVFGKSQEPIKAMIMGGVEAFQERSMLDKIYSMDTTNNYAEKYTSETSLGDFADVGENGAYPKTGMQEGYSKVIEPTTWKSSFEVTQEMIEDAKISQIKKRANMFSLSYNRTREKFGAMLLAGGTAATVKIGNKTYSSASADAQPLFSKVHPSITKNTGVQSNIFSSTDIKKSVILDKVQEAMQSFTDDDGNLMNVAPDTIIIPNSAVMKRAVFAMVGSEFDAESSNNALNFQCGLWNVIVWPYLPKQLNSKDYFFLMDSKFKDAFLCAPWLDRVKLTVKSDIDPNTDANVFKGRARFGAGFNNWRFMALCGEGVTGTSLDG